MPHEDRRFDPRKCDALISSQRWDRWNPPQLLALSGLRGGQTVLDLGSGPGFWTIPIADIVGLSGRVIALDGSRELLKALAARNPPPHVEPLQAELPAINLPDASVDVIWAAFIFHEVQPPPVLASEMRRVLRPSGRLDVLDWHPDASSNGGPPREHRFLPKQVSEYLRAAGFHDIQEIWQDEDAYLLAAE